MSLLGNALLKAIKKHAPDFDSIPALLKAATSAEWSKIMAELDPSAKEKRNKSKAKSVLATTSMGCGAEAVRHGWLVIGW